MTRDITDGLCCSRRRRSPPLPFMPRMPGSPKPTSDSPSPPPERAHFLAVTAHELRSPVGVVAGSTDLLVGHRHRLSEDEASELVEGIAAAAGRLRRLVDDLLAAARVHGTAIEFVRSPWTCAPLTRTVRLMERTLDFEIRLADVPDVRVNADPDRFSQMMENLLSNAAQHGVAPATVAVSRSGATVEIAVLDAGEGVGESMQERLFERFATSGQGGTGLGLYIVREASPEHTRATSSTRRRTSAFVIRLPAAEPLVTTAQRIRVLLVDDHEEVRGMLRTALRLHGGFEVVGEAEDGVGAVRLVGSSDPDIVLLDLGLPDVDGREVLTRIRARRPASKVVIFSGADRDDRAWYVDRSDGYVLERAELTVLLGVLESVAAPLPATGIDLPRDLASVADARRFVHDALVSGLAPDLTDEAFLVVSQLAANAITHAESDYRVSVVVSSGQRPDLGPRQRPRDSRAQGQRARSRVRARPA